MARVAIHKFGDFEQPLSERTPRGVYCARLEKDGADTRAALSRYVRWARRSGAVREGRLENPDGARAEAVAQALGEGFDGAAERIEAALSGLETELRRATARAIAAECRMLAEQGKPPAVRRNLCVKLVCWLTGYFGGLLPLLDGDAPPKALIVNGGVTAHELALARVLSELGADVLLVQTDGGAACAKLDPEERWSQRLELGGVPFPANFALDMLEPAMPATRKPTLTPQTPTPAAQKPAPAAQRSTPAAQKPAPAGRPRGAVVPENYFTPPVGRVNPNAWMREPEVGQLLASPQKRGDAPDVYNTALLRLTGVRDRAGYASSLHELYEKLKATGRRVCVVDGPMPEPGPEEVAAIRRRGRYPDAGELIVDLATNLPDAKGELLRLMQRAFVDVMKAQARQKDSLRALETAAVYLLCRARRYHQALFEGWRAGQVPVFILMGGCAGPDDALYVRWLSKLPADVLLIAPDLSRPCAFSDPALLELRGEDSLPLARFPREGAASVNTLAADAERELAGTLAGGPVIERADAVTLRTTYDELFILWHEQPRYRQGYRAEGGRAALPVLYARVNGVEGGDAAAYWQRVKGLMGPDVLYYANLPMLPAGCGSPFQQLALKCVRNRRLDRKTLTEDPRYPFGLLRPEVQAHLLDKLSLMLNQRLIRGTFENGAEYTVVSTVLGLSQAYTRRFQALDFAGDAPKLLCVSAGAGEATLEDAILMTFLHLVGFDVALFAPAGYRGPERFMAENLPEEHQPGPFLYDLTVPDLEGRGTKGRSFLERFLGRRR